MGIYMEQINIRHYTLVQGFCLFWLFLMEGKGLIEHIYIYETTTRQPADAYPHVIYCLTKW